MVTIDPITELYFDHAGGSTRATTRLAECFLPLIESTTRRQYRRLPQHRRNEDGRDELRQSAALLTMTALNNAPAENVPSEELVAFVTRAYQVHYGNSAVALLMAAIVASLRSKSAPWIDQRELFD